MRFGFGLVVGLFVLAGTFGASVAGPPQGKTVSPPPTSVTALDRATRPQNVRQSSPQIAVAPLSVEECTQVGGTVKDDAAGFCQSGKYCATTDKDGKSHAACLTGNIW